MARTFTRASSHVLRLGSGVGPTFGPGTMAFIARKASDPAAYSVPLSFGQADATAWFIHSAGSTDLQVWNGTVDIVAPFGWAASDGWCLIAVTKASGTVAPRFHKYVFSTNTWTHSNASATGANRTPSGGAQLGAEQSAAATFAGFFDGDIEIAGAWGVVLADDEIEALAYSLMGWFKQNPALLVMGDQSAVAQKVVDLSGHAFNESAITGTAVSTGSVPVFNRTDGVWIPGIKVVGGSTVTFAATPAGAAAITADDVRALSLAASPAGAAVVAAAEATALSFAAAAVGAAAIASAAAITRSLSTSPVGAAAITADAAITRGFSTSPAGAAAISAAEATTVGMSTAPAGAAAVTGDVSVTRAFSTSPAGAAAIAAAVARTVTVASSPAGAAAVAADLGVIRGFSTSPAGAAAVAAALTVSGAGLKTFSVDLAGAAAVTAAESVVRGFSTSAAGAASVTGSMSGTVGLRVGVVGASSIIVGLTSGRVIRRDTITAEVGCQDVVIPEVGCEDVLTGGVSKRVGMFVIGVTTIGQSVWVTRRDTLVGGGPRRDTLVATSGRRDIL